MMKTTFVIRGMDILEQPIRFTYLYDGPIPRIPPTPRRVQVQRNLRNIYEQRMMPMLRSLNLAVEDVGAITVEDFPDEEFDVVVIPKPGPERGKWIKTVSPKTERVIIETIRDLLKYGYKLRDIRTALTYFYPITFDDVSVIVDLFKRGEV